MSGAYGGLEPAGNRPCIKPQQPNEPKQLKAKNQGEIKMGVYIYLKIAASVKPDEWNQVLHKSADFATMLGLPVKWYKITPTVRFSGWDVDEDDGVFFPEDLDESSADPAFADPMREQANWAVASPEIPEITSNALWGGKVYSGSAMTSYCAIGCYVEHLLGAKALLEGDFSYEQSLRAAQMATLAAGEKIEPPVVCRIQALGERIRAIHELPEMQQIQLLEHEYMGPPTALGDYIRQAFPRESIEAYLREELSGFHTNYGVDCWTREVFRLDFSPADFLACIPQQTDPDTCRLIAEHILQYVKCRPIPTASGDSFAYLGIWENPETGTLTMLNRVMDALNQYPPAAGDLSEMLQKALKRARANV